MQTRYFLLLISSLVLHAHVNFAHSQSVASVPFNNLRLPSDDLVFEGKKLRSDEASELGKSGIDLSTLNPAPSAVWSQTIQDSSIDNSLPVESGDLAQFTGSLLSANGMYRFNAVVGTTTAIVHLDKTLHTMLLRKNILRLMGYQVPAIKWLNRLSVKFENLAQMNDFLDSQIPRATLGAASRWLVSKDETNFTVILKDIAVTVPSANDHYNLAQGTPPQALTNRTLRALIIPYALLDLSESANKLEWTVGKISNNEVVLPHFTRSTFTTTLDDAKWSLNLLKAIPASDLALAVEMAHFPKEVSLLLTEKILSRRNALLSIFSVSAEKFAVNTKISSGEALHEGKITQEDWSDYASRFAHGDPESPFKDFHWYALAKIQSIIIDNLVSKATEEMVFLDPREGRNEFIVDQFKEGLDHYIKTGEFLTYPVRTWFHPILGLGMNVSRDVVVGNYLGTDNLVQIADSLSWSFRVGGQIGVENIEVAPTVSVTGTGSVTKSWSHLKPLRNLKQALKEPYKNMAVPLLKWQIQKDLKRLKAISESDKPEIDWNVDKDDSELSEIMTHFNKNLGVGESILLTETITPLIGLSATAAETLMPVGAKVTANVSANIIRRVQFYRKDANTIQVYDDVGEGFGWSFDISAQKYFSLARLGFKNQKGHYSVKLHEVDINSDIKKNPKLFDKAHALSTFMQTGSSELMEDMQKPHVITATFKDKSAKLAILAWRLKKLNANTSIKVESANGLSGDFVSFTDESQRGWNWEAFAKDIINYGVGRVMKGVEWANSPFQNPAETLFGMGETTSVRFEASLDQEAYEERFMRLTDRWEGWSAKVKKVQDKMREINHRFGFMVFDELSMNNASGLKLFNVAVNINLYEEGIKRLASIPMDTFIHLEVKKETESGIYERGCEPQKISNRRFSNGQRIETCGHLRSVISLSNQCQAKIQNGLEEEGAKCLAKLFRKIYSKLNYNEIKDLIGKDNMFVHGSVNGFRGDDEILNDPIISNTEGRIGGEFWNGPFEVVQRMLGMQSGEFNGYWLRERL